MVTGFSFENVGNVQMDGCSASDLDVGVEAKGVGTIALENVLLKNNQTGFIGKDIRDLLLKDVQVEGRVDPQVAASMHAAFVSDPSLSAESLADSFGDTLKGQGIDLWTWVSRGASAAQIVALVAQLAIR